MIAPKTERKLFSNARTWLLLQGAVFFFFLFLNPMIAFTADVQQQEYSVYKNYTILARIVEHARETYHAASKAEYRSLNRSNSQIDDVIETRCKKSTAVARNSRSNNRVTVVNYVRC